MDKMIIQSIPLESRNCESCGSHNLETLWEYTHIAQTRHKSWEFQVSNVICKDCGFVFVSPAPTIEILSEYYSDSYSRFQEQTLDYDVHKRLEFIKKNVSNLKERIFVEIGSNQKSEFQKRLNEDVQQLYTVEINQSCDRDYLSVDKLPTEFTDVVAHYFVLEHIPKIREFILQCFNILKPGGLMICEVPDINLYDDKIAALILHEHCNHFSLEVLTQICEDIGLKLIDSSSSLCSRSFGFVACFIKNDLRESNIKQYPSQYFKNKDTFLKGVSKVNQFKILLAKVYQQVVDFGKENKTVILWAANDNLIKFFENKEIPKNVTVIDSDSRKKNYSDRFLTFQPEEAKQDILDSDAIVIFTNIHSDAILSFVDRQYQKVFKNVTVIDFN